MNRISKSFYQLIISALLALLIFTGSPSHTDAAVIKLNKTSLSVEIGSSEKLRLTGTTKKVTWSSSSKKIAAVTGKGVITGKKAGQATITASVRSKEAKKRTFKCRVTVIPHDYKSKVVAATKEHRGYTQYTCSRCNKSYKKNYTDFQPDEHQVYADMIALQNKYPEGLHWTDDVFYRWKGGILSGGSGCAAFAFLLSDRAFGYLEATYHRDFDHIRVGDIIRLNGNTHTVIALEVTDEGIIVAEGNYSSSIHWGRLIPYSDIQKATYVLTRYPE